MTFTLFRECDGTFGCDCKERARKEQKRLKNLLGHGTRAKYQRGCRCLPCRRANAKYHRDYARNHR